MTENSSSVVAKAAATISRDKNLQPLRALCVRKVALSLQFYVDKGVTNLSKHLLPKLCEEVFDMYQQQVEHKQLNMCKNEFEQLYTKLNSTQLFKIACLFMSSELKCFKTSVFGYLKWPMDYIYKRRFFKKLAEEAPKLASFEFQDEFNDIGEDSIENTMSPSQYFPLTQMSQLITLKVQQDFRFTEAELRIVASSMPLLRSLEIYINDGWKSDEGLFVTPLQQLKMLEHLVLFFRSSNNEGPIEFCLQKMPKLKTAIYRVNRTSSVGPSSNHHSFSIFKQMKAPVELSLEHLSLWKDFPPANVRLPHVTHLHVYGLEAVKFCLTRSFPKLKELFISAVPFEDVRILLQHLGHPLTSLCFYCVEGLCDLQEILNLCPQLESLLFESSYVKEIGFIDPSTCRCLAKMKNFILGHVRNFYGDSSFCEAAGLLRLLMTSCPDLEELNLQVTLPQEEVDGVAAGIAAGAYLCIPKIKDVRVVIVPKIAQKSMENFVQQVVAHCPKLASIYVDNVNKRKLAPLIATICKFHRGKVMHHFIYDDTY